MFSSEITLATATAQHIPNMVGELDQNLHAIERQLGVEISYRSGQFRLMGDEASVESAKTVLREIYGLALFNPVSAEQVMQALSSIAAAPPEPEQSLDELLEAEESFVADVTIQTRNRSIQGRNPNQKRYLLGIQQNTLSFGVGPAGTGKTWLAVASAVEALRKEEVARLVLVRPAVEAGEKLGFLPGDMAEKIDPYLRPLYDALYEMLGFEKVQKLIDRNVIEVAPLAFMRGRTLNDAFIIMDEAQNTTVEQMKMFLTRIGFGSRAVVTGDVTQIDLPRHATSGLRHVIEVLRRVEGVHFSFFQSGDVVRHPLVQRIVQAYESHDALQQGDG
ncbi:MAG: PhoH family protein [Gammaproteobacteria bacterium]